MHGTPSRFARVALRLAALGTISYSVYLVHVPLMVLVTRLAVHLGVDSLALLFPLRFAVAMLAGVLYFRLVESRYLRPAAPTREPLDVPGDAELTQP